MSWNFEETIWNPLKLICIKLFQLLTTPYYVYGELIMKVRNEMEGEGGFNFGEYRKFESSGIQIGYKNPFVFSNKVWAKPEFHRPCRDS